jgi:hypothetical protein
MVGERRQGQLILILAVCEVLLALCLPAVTMNGAFSPMTVCLPHPGELKSSAATPRGTRRRLNVPLLTTALPPTPMSLTRPILARTWAAYGA